MIITYFGVESKTKSGVRVFRELRDYLKERNMMATRRNKEQYSMVMCTSNWGRFEVRLRR